MRAAAATQPGSKIRTTFDTVAPAVNCKDFREHITDAVDTYLSEAEMKQFLDHANACPPCRSEYEAEASTKRFVAMHAHMVDTPASVKRAILDRLDERIRRASRTRCLRRGSRVS